MDDEVKALLREIRDETIKTNQRLDELRNATLTGAEKQPASQGLFDNEQVQLRKKVPKNEIWWLVFVAVVLAVLYIGNELAFS